MAKTKPFLILQLRPEKETSDNELEAFIHFGRIENFERRRIDQQVLGKVDLNKYSGVIIGGGPSNVSDKEESKSDNQKRFEDELDDLLDQIIETDFPFLGACYGIGILARHVGGMVSKNHPEGAGAVEISLTEDGKKDPLTSGLTPVFRAFAGHKEAVDSVPADVKILCANDACPVQMI